MTRAEITLKQFVESVWFHFAWRLVVMIGVPAFGLCLSAISGYIAWAVVSTKSQLTETAETVQVNTGNIATLKTGMLAYKADQDTFQAKAQDELSLIRESQARMQIDIARMSGVLEAIRRDTVKEPAAAAFTHFSPE